MGKKTANRLSLEGKLPNEAVVKVEWKSEERKISRRSDKKIRTSADQV